MADRRVDVEVLVMMTWTLPEEDGRPDMTEEDIKTEIRKDVDDAMKGIKDDFFEEVDWEHAIVKDHQGSLKKEGEFVFNFAKKEGA